MIDLLGSAAVARCGTASVTQAGSNYARKSPRPDRAARRSRLGGGPGAAFPVLVIYPSSIATFGSTRC